MKKLLTVFIFLMVISPAIKLMALNPFWYQGLAINQSGQYQPNLIATLGVRVTITENLTQIYYEEFTGISTDQFAMFQINVGTGINTVGTFNSIVVSAATLIKVDVRQGANPYVTIAGANLSAAMSTNIGQINTLGWSTKGNNRTDEAINFIGTTDAHDLVLRTNNTERLRLTQAGRLLFGNAEDNIFLGQAGNETTTGIRNIASGLQALYSNTIGHDNIANGENVLYSNTSGSDNIANGWQALYLNTTGGDNIANGYQALSSNTTGGNNIANGSSALYSNINGGNNIANGWQSLYSNTTGGDNMANGYQALYHNTIGVRNIANGYQALWSNTTGHNNIANGYQALILNTTGIFNIATGYQALLSNTTGDNNMANGFSALFSNTTGGNNIANGFTALYSNTTGYNNIATGYEALYSNTTGWDNIATGYRALYLNTTGGNNIANGFTALYSNTTGHNNIANGYATLLLNTIGSYNIGIGVRAGYNNSHNYVNYIGRVEADAIQDEATIIVGDLFLKDPTGSGGATTGNRIYFNSSAVAGLKYNTGTGEIEAIDNAGNITTISPHNFSLLPEGNSEDMSWSFYSKNDEKGKQINVDMLKVVRLMEKMSGEKLVYQADLKGNVIDNSKETEKSLKEQITEQNKIISEQSKAIEELMNRIKLLEEKK